MFLMIILKYYVNFVEYYSLLNQLVNLFICLEF